MVKKTQKFPQTIFVGLDSDFVDEELFVCETDESEFASLGEKRRYAVYQYVETREIEATLSTKKVDK